MTSRMHAHLLSELDGPAGLRWTQVDTPPMGDGILIRVHAAGVGFPDLLQTRGLYQDRPVLPFVPGLEVAGEVVQAPSGSHWRPGDRVIGACLGGGYAELAASEEHLVFRWHPALGAAEAVASLINYQTAYLALVERGRLVAGEHVVVRGAAGGVGTAAVQVATHLGADVTAIVSTEEKAEFARLAGAVRIIVGESSEHPPGDADLVLDPVGGSSLDPLLRWLRPGGRLVVAGFASGVIPAVSTNRVLLRNVDVLGAAWGTWVAARSEAASILAEGVESLVAAGLRPLVSRTFPLEQAIDALGALESRTALGKVVLLQETDGDHEHD